MINGVLRNKFTGGRLFQRGVNFIEVTMLLLVGGIIASGVMYNLNKKIGDDLVAAEINNVYAFFDVLYDCYEKKTCKFIDDKWVRSPPDNFDAKFANVFVDSNKKSDLHYGFCPNVVLVLCVTAVEAKSVQMELLGLMVRYIDSDIVSYQQSADKTVVVNNVLKFRAQKPGTERLFVSVERSQTTGIELNRDSTIRASDIPWQSYSRDLRNQVDFKGVNLKLGVVSVQGPFGLGGALFEEYVLYENVELKSNPIVINKFLLMFIRMMSVISYGKIDWSVGKEFYLKPRLDYYPVRHANQTWYSNYSLPDHRFEKLSYWGIEPALNKLSLSHCQWGISLFNRNTWFAEYSFVNEHSRKSYLCNTPMSYESLPLYSSRNQFIGVDTNKSMYHYLGQADLFFNNLLENYGVGFVHFHRVSQCGLDLPKWQVRGTSIVMPWDGFWHGHSSAMSFPHPHSYPRVVDCRTGQPEYGGL